MITMRPITIRAAQLTSSTLTYPAAGETAWSGASVAYAVGNTVSYENNGLIHKYECKTAHTSTAINYPVPYPNETANWLDLGAVNRYKMFHLERNDQSVGASPLVVEITPGERFGAVGLGRLVADSVTIEVYDGATQIYTETKDLISRSVASWYDYFYQPFRQIENTASFDLPVLSTAKLKLTFTRASGNVSVGFVVLGMPFIIGETEFKAKARALNFTTVERDAFGNAKVDIKRDVPKTSQTVEIEKSNLDSARKLISDLNGVVTLWAGIYNPLDSYFDSLYIIGFYRDREFSVDNAKNAYLNIELEGV